MNETVKISICRDCGAQVPVDPYVSEPKICFKCGSYKVFTKEVPL
jgi:ribosomal protein L40E